MKAKNKAVPLPQKTISQDNQISNRLDTWRRILPRIMAVFLIIVFLASECAALFPGQ